MLSKDEILDTLEKMSLRELVDLARGFRERILGEYDDPNTPEDVRHRWEEA